MLAPDEPAPFELVDGSADPPIVVVCDHASNRIPRALEGLGLDDHLLRDHIAWDIGAAGVARRIAERLGARAVLGRYSRLVVDLNRSPRDASAFPPISDGILVPGNVGLDREARLARERALFTPYHAAVAALVAECSSAERVPVFLGVHSFTPRFYRTERPWHIGVLWDKDPRLALPLLAALRANAGLAIGDNEPYSGRHPADYTIDTHAEPNGLACAGIEIRQDLIVDERGQERWAGILGDALERILRDRSLYRRAGA